MIDTTKGDIIMLLIVTILLLFYIAITGLTQGYNQNKCLGKEGISFSLNPAVKKTSHSGDRIICCDKRNMTANLYTGEYEDSPSNCWEVSP